MGKGKAERQIIGCRFCMNKLSLVFVWSEYQLALGFFTDLPTHFLCIHPYDCCLSFTVHSYLSVLTFSLENAQLLLSIASDYHTINFSLRTFLKDCIPSFLLPLHQTTDSQRNKVLISNLQYFGHWTSFDFLQCKPIYLLFCMWAHVGKNSWMSEIRAGDGRKSGWQITL